MAWLLSKTENFLNNLDQSASSALTNDSPTHKSQTHMNGGSTNQSYNTSYDASNYSNSGNHLPTSASAASLSATDLAATANIRRTPSESTLNGTSLPIKPRSSTPSGTKILNKQEEDEKLFEFLNSPSTAGTEKRKEKKSNNGKHSRQSSTSSTVSSRSLKTEGLVMNVPDSSSAQNNPGEDQPDGDEPVVNLLPSNERSESPVQQPVENHQPTTDQHQLSSLELENKLLKNEVASLNQEMASALNRAKKAQTELNEIRQDMLRRESQMTGSDAIIRQLRAHEEDLAEELNAKNSQLAVLRVRLQEADQQVKAKTQQLTQIQSENDRILKDHSDSSGIQSQALDSIREKLTESDHILQREKEAFKATQVEFMERQSKMEQDQQRLAEALTTAQKKVNDEKHHASNLNTQLHAAKSQVEAAKQELGDYKQKATRILQSKDKLINSLKEGSAGTNEAGATSLINMEVEELKNEKDMLRDELQQANGKIEQLRTELQDLEALQQSESDTAQDQIRDLEDSVKQMQQQLRDTEIDLTRRSEELKYAEEESHRQKLSLQSRVQEREEELQKVQNQLIARTANSTSQSELEGRLHALTESLIQKQTMLETLSTEKTSLSLQLERLEKQYREVHAMATTTSNSHVVHMGHTEDEEGVRQRTMPLFMREKASDGGVAKNVKRAANTIDRFSIRLGVFLRRYPIARLFVIGYMILLHLWVMVVLLTYSPEMHGTDFHPQHPVAPGHQQQPVAPANPPQQPVHLKEA
ncbi:golgin subfamily A member 5-like [Amphiura filiformis]|uniref:golgin subfamily A member 5-like n=1 Tax=Amphiura filiformis TaxID=82378 RepID=UPI003B21E97C